MCTFLIAYAKVFDYEGHEHTFEPLSILHIFGKDIEIIITYSGSNQSSYGSKMSSVNV